MKIEDHVDRMLDQALEMTFPASDPISVFMPRVDVTDEKKDRRDEATEAFPYAA